MCIRGPVRIQIDRYEFRTTLDLSKKVNQENSFLVPLLTEHTMRRPHPINPPPPHTPEEKRKKCVIQKWHEKETLGLLLGIEKAAPEAIHFPDK